MPAAFSKNPKSFVHNVQPSFGDDDCGNDVEEYPEHETNIAKTFSRPAASHPQPQDFKSQFMPQDHHNSVFMHPNLSLFDANKPSDQSRWDAVKGAGTDAQSKLFKSLTLLEQGQPNATASFKPREVPENNVSSSPAHYEFDSVKAKNAWLA